MNAWTKDTKVEFRCTKAEKKAFAKAASRVGLSQWLRSLARKASGMGAG